MDGAETRAAQRGSCPGATHHEPMPTRLEDLALVVLGLATKGLPESVWLPLLLDLLRLPAWSHHARNMIGHVTLITTAALHRSGGGAA